MLRVIKLPLVAMIYCVASAFAEITVVRRGRTVGRIRMVREVVWSDYMRGWRWGGGEFWKETTEAEGLDEENRETGHPQILWQSLSVRQWEKIQCSCVKLV